MKAFFAEKNLVHNNILQLEVKKTMLVEFELQHWCCGPKGCQIEIEYGEMMDVED